MKLFLTKLRQLDDWGTILVITHSISARELELLVTEQPKVPDYGKAEFRILNVN
jgi:hypothetical protein